MAIDFGAAAMAKKKAQSTGNGRARKNKKQPETKDAAYALSLTVRNVRCFGDEPQTLDLSDGNGNL